MSEQLLAARSALARYAVQGDLTAVEVGLINVTYRVTQADGQAFALQRLNPIFDPAVHRDIEAVTRHLEAKGLQTPRLVRTRDEALWVDEGAGVWRLMTWVDGENLNRLDGPARAEAAGQLLGRFHAALQDLDHQFEATRLGVHDTPEHLRGLRTALAEGEDHRLFGEVEPEAQAILRIMDEIGALPELPERVVHGDPKLNNLVFDAATGEGRAMIDLDTLARMPVILELGDAFRSWCNPGGEEAAPKRFDVAGFERALAGYAAGSEGLLEPPERDGLVAATLTIALELAARFARDALEERYFGYDAARYGTRGEHNLARARVQLAFARALVAVRDDAERAVARQLGDSHPSPG